MLVPKINKKNNKKQNEKGKNRILISVKVVGSAGPIRLIVNEDDVVADVVEKALKIYACQGRLPVLGSNVKDFQLFCPAAESDYLDPRETIGCFGARNFMLCKKPQLKTGTDDGLKKDVSVKAGGKGTGALKSLINKSLKVVNVIAAH
ncbi:unnamed protein product [Rhodiola kirilowii]